MLTLLLLIPAAAIAAIVAGAPAKRTALAATGINLFLGALLAVRFVPGAPGFQFEQSIPAANQDKIGSISFWQVREPCREIADQGHDEQGGITS